MGHIRNVQIIIKINEVTYSKQKRALDLIAVTHIITGTIMPCF